MTERLTITISEAEMQAYADKINAIFGVTSPVKARVEKYEQQSHIAKVVDCPFSLEIEYKVPAHIAKGIKARTADEAVDGKALAELPAREMNDPEVLENYATVPGKLVCAFFYSRIEEGRGLLKEDMSMLGRIVKRGRDIFVVGSYAADHTKVLHGQVVENSNAEESKTLALEPFDGLLQKARENRDEICDFTKVALRCQKEQELGDAITREFKIKDPNREHKAVHHEFDKDLPELKGRKLYDSVALAIALELGARKGASRAA